MGKIGLDWGWNPFAEHGLGKGKKCRSSPPPRPPPLFFSSLHDEEGYPTARSSTTLVRARRVPMYTGGKGVCIRSPDPSIDTSNSTPAAKGPSLPLIRLPLERSPPRGHLLPHSCHDALDNRRVVLAKPNLYAHAKVAAFRLRVQMYAPSHTRADPSYSQARQKRPHNSASIKPRPVQSPPTLSSKHAPFTMDLGSNISPMRHNRMFSHAFCQTSLCMFPDAVRARRGHPQGTE